MKPGRSWIFGDDVDTDQLAPGAYMKSSLEELASHCLERLNPDFAKQVQSGDIVVGGGILVRDHHGNRLSKAFSSLVSPR